MTRRFAAVLLLGSIGMGLAVDALAAHHAAGLNSPVLVAALLVVLVAAAGRRGISRVDPADLWLPFGALLFSGFAVARTEAWLVQLDVALALVLTGGTAASLAGARITRGVLPEVVGVAGSVVAAACTSAATPLRAVRPASALDLVRLPAPVVPVLRGVLIAAPVLTAFAILFAAADAVFASMAAQLLAIDVDIDPSRFAGSATVVAVVAWGVAGLLSLVALGGLRVGDALSTSAASTGGAAASAAGVAAVARPAAIGAAAGLRPPDPANPAGPRIRQKPGRPTVEATVILVLVDLLFAGFVAVQFAYLFGGRDTLEASGMTYADYARRGFFELICVAAMAAVLAVLLDVGVGGGSRVQRAASVGLLVLTGLVLVSAFQRLALYQAAFGWTELRFMVVVSIAWLAAGLAAIGILLVRGRIGFVLHALGVLFLVGVAAVNVVGPQDYVARQNLDRALDPTLVPAGGRTGLDGAYLATLGDGAVPATVAALDGLATEERLELERFLAVRERALASEPGLQGWPAWNLVREEARQALVRWRAAGE